MLFGVASLFFSSSRFQTTCDMDRKHKREIQLWLDNPDAEVWCKETTHSSWWRADTPNFNLLCEYRVILPEFADAWQAFLSGELQFLSGIAGETWRDWDYSDASDAPKFPQPPASYRRKPRKEDSPAELIERIPGEIVILRDSAGEVVSVQALWQKDD